MNGGHTFLYAKQYTVPLANWKNWCFENGVKWTITFEKIPG